MFLNVVMSFYCCLKGGSIRACRQGVGGVPIPTTGEKLSTLPTLWAWRILEGGGGEPLQRTA